MEVVIRVNNLQKKFSHLVAVNDLSFEVKKNEIFALLGPNGAGKTTTINMLCGLLSPSAGSIEFTEGSDKKSLIGYCPQENIFYPKLTCFEQLIFTGQMYGIENHLLKSRAIMLLEQLGLVDKKNTKAADLSGGMKRRLNICLALIHNPPILILDEPEAGLDPQSRILVRDFIRNFGQTKTIILTTHNMDEADRLADRIAIVDHGRLLCLDTPSNLKKNIGSGTILEFSIDKGNQEMLSIFLASIANYDLKVKANNHSIVIQNFQNTELIGLLKKCVETAGLQIMETKLRESSLEDVFIELTGRELRE